MLTEAAFHLLLAGTLLSQTVRDAAAVALLALLAYERLWLDDEAGRGLLPAVWLWSVGAFLGASLLSAFASADPAASLEQLRFYPIGLLIFVGARRVVFSGGFSRIAAVVLVLVAIFGFDAMAQYLVGRSFLRENTPIWGRFQGGLVFPSDVSLLPILLPIGVAAVLGGRAARPWLGILSVALVEAAVNLSGTRSAWCAMLLLAVGLGWVYRRPRLALLLVAIELLVSLGTGRLVVASAPRRLVSVATYTAEKRLVQWQAALALFREAPVFGHGPHSFKRVVTERHGEPSVVGRVELAWAPYPHSIYLETLSGMGALGFAALIALLGLELRVLHARRSSTAARVTLVSLGLFASVGVFDMSLVKDWVQLCFWLPLGIAAGLPPSGYPVSVTRVDPAGGGAEVADLPPPR